MKDRVITREHHRRASSLDGSNDPANISYVKNKPHTAWHVLVGNMNAFQICDLLNHLGPYYNKPKNFIIVCKFINGSEVKKKGQNNSKNKMKVSRAWEILFKGLSFKEIISYINNVWLDPSYHLYLEKIKK